MPHEGLPQGLNRLFSDGGAGRVLDVDLPPGRLVVPSDDYTDAVSPAYWLSDEPADPDLWVRLHRAHQRSGLWPVLAASFYADPDRPWVIGEVSPEPVTDIDDLDAGEVLASLWKAHVRPGRARSEFPELQPFGRNWPGLASAVDSGQDPETFADQYVRSHNDESRVVLIAAARGADVLTVLGWQGPLNHTNVMAPLSSVLRSWEVRFGARVIRLGFDTLHLSVAAAPVTAAHAQRVAAEHLAFCPDNILAGPGTIAAYAADIQGADGWGFWWD